MTVQSDSTARRRGRASVERLAPVVAALAGGGPAGARPRGRVDAEGAVAGEHDVVAARAELGARDVHTVPAPRSHLRAVLAVPVVVRVVHADVHRLRARALVVAHVEEHLGDEGGAVTPPRSALHRGPLYTGCHECENKWPRGVAAPPRVASTSARPTPGSGTSNATRAWSSAVSASRMSPRTPASFVSRNEPASATHAPCGPEAAQVFPSPHVTARAENRRFGL